MQGGIGRTRMPAQNLNHFTAATGPAIVRGDRLPADMKGNLLFTEPVGRLIRRAAIDNIEGLTQLRNVYPGAEFMTSTDQLFRPVNISNAPDGTVYIADMYHGIIQELQWSGPGSYLRAKIEQYQLDKVAAHGRIWRLRYDGRPAVPATATNIGQPAIPADRTGFRAAADVQRNAGAARDAPLASERMVARHGAAAADPEAGQVGRARRSSRSRGSSDNLLARFHALWTLEGLGALDPRLVREAMEDTNPRMRVQAIRASETLYKAGDKTFAGDYRALAKDADTERRHPGDVDAESVQAAGRGGRDQGGAGGNKAKGVALIADRLLAPAADDCCGGGRGGPLTPEEEKRLQQGSEVFGARVLRVPRHRRPGPADGGCAGRAR